jgi:Tol biopolymer transport system component
MKSTRALVGIVLAVVLCTSLALAQSGYDLFQKGLVKERAEGDLQAAIQIFQRIVKEFPNNRELAAKALVEMGDCYEKLSRSEALKAYQRVLHDYADQNAEANEARARLAALEHGGAHGNEMVMRRIWAGSDVDYEGAPSPDGKYLSYVDWDTGDLAAFNLATGEKHRLTHKGTWVENSDFAEFSVPSADGRQIAYAWFKDNESKYELRVIGSDGSHPRTVYKNDAVDYVEPKAWSPDGKRILAVLQLKNESMQIAMIGVADGALHVLKTLKQDPLWLTTMGISPDGRYIAYTAPQKDDETRHDISLLSVDGKNEARLVTNPANDYFLGWTPNADTVLFASDRTGAVSVWAVDVMDGQPHGRQRLVKSDVGRILPLGVTHYGSLYYSLNDSVRDIYTAAFDFATGKLMAGPQAVTERFTGANAAPAWSPDGKYLAYLSRRHRPRSGPSDFGADTIVVRSLATGEEREITPNVMYMNAFAGLGWWPDGLSVLVMGMEKDTRSGLLRVDAETGEVSVLFHRSHDEGLGFPRMTPDGKTLIYFGGPEPPQIRARNIKTGKVRQLRGLNPHVYPSGLAISPDGFEIAFDTQAYHDQPPALEVVSVEGGNPRVLYQLKNPAAFAWNSLAWTPDGKRLVFGVIPGGMVAGAQKADLWEIAAAGGEPRKLDVTGDTVRHLQISPDGHHVSFESGARSFEIDVMENLLPALKASR